MTVNNQFSLFDAGVALFSNPQWCFMCALSSALIAERVATFFKLDCTVARSCKTIGNAFATCVSFSDGVIAIQALYRIVHDIRTVWPNRMERPKEIQRKNHDFTTQTCPKQWLVERVVASSLQFFGCFIDFSKFLAGSGVISYAPSCGVQIVGKGCSILHLFYCIYESTRKMEAGPPDFGTNLSLQRGSFEYRELYHTYNKYEIAKKSACIFLKVIGMISLFNLFKKNSLSTKVSKHYKGLFLSGFTFLTALIAMQHFSATAKMQWIKSTW